MMDFSGFIQQANTYGANKRPFFFLIDFEQQSPVICPVEQAAEKGIFFAIQGVSNIKTERSAQCVQFEKKPIAKSLYAQGFHLVQQEIQNGNSYLLNLTYPTEVSLNCDLMEIFQRSNAPYKLCYQDQFVCFSPESFIKIAHNQIFTYPMKGTINANLPNAAQQLLNSEKEMQEHYTIVDLMRNDLALVAERIEVTKFRYIEKIDTQKGAILQTSSEICGHLDANWQQQIGSILAKLLPAGSISGAPKEKTVEIIQRAEQQPRGYYTGIFGLFDGESLNSAVAIRFIEQKQDKFFFRSGGGITMLSNLDDEYQELIEKVYLPIGEQ